mgnify:CR=1 FL=1
MGAVLATQATDADGNAMPAMETMETMETMAPMAPFVPAPNVPLTLSQLTNFLRNPVKAFFRQRLQVVFDETQEEDADDESFGVDGLQRYGLLQDLLTSATAQPDETQEQLCVQQSLAKLRKSGDLPLKVFGDIEQLALEQTLSQMLSAWRAEQAAYPHAARRQSVRCEAAAVVLEDWVDHLRRRDVQADAEGGVSIPVAWLELQPSKLLFKVRGKHFAQPEKLLGAWVRSLAVAASGAQVQGVLVGLDGVVRIPPMAQAEAVGALQDLLRLWLDGMNAPLPLPSKTALAFVAEAKPATIYDGGHMNEGEVKDACLARMYPDYDALIEDGRFEDLAQAVYAPLLQWAQQLSAEPHATQAASQEVAA